MFNFSTPISDAVKNFSDITKFERENTVGFGVPFLDDLFDGLSPKDLFLIGGGTGGGKSQLALAVACEAAKSGRRVSMYALEAEKDEMMMRALYRKFANWYFSSKRFTAADVTFSNFMRGEPSELIDDFKKTGQFNLNEFDNLEIKYQESGFTIEDLEKSLIESVASGSKMIVIDHLHYFELLTDNENQEVKRIIKTIRSHILENNIPVVLVAHIRKQNEMIQKLTPGSDDFHGSSDIIKISTKAVTIQSAMNTKIGRLCEMVSNGKTKIEFIEDDAPITGGTFIRAVKNRRDGSKSAYTLFSAYDISTGGYKKGYMLGQPIYVNGKIAFNKIDPVFKPYWAKNFID